MSYFKSDHTLSLRKKGRRRGKIISVSGRDSKPFNGLTETIDHTAMRPLPFRLCGHKDTVNIEYGRIGARHWKNFSTI